MRLALRLGRNVAVLAFGFAVVVCSSARADRAFTPRFSTNASGDITVIGNTLETCSSSAANCLNARAGTGSGSVLDNNSYVMERVDVDRTGLDSSSARLTLPSGARVLFAGLYYGARTNAGTSGKAAPNSSPAALSTVDLKLPGASAYERLTGQLDQSVDVTGAYGVFVNTTDQVQRGGSGIYTVANVQSATGMDRYAGWALVVAYEAAGDPPRNLTVFDGLQSVTSGKPAVTIPLSGFQTPLSGPVRTKLGFVAYEGDLGISGDSASLNGTPLTDALNPANNFFNSKISVDGVNRTNKNPDYVNQLGFDAKLIGAGGILANGATSASIALKTTSDQYLPHAITFATDLYAPVIRATKTVANLTHPGGPTRPGDTLRYTVTYANTGLEAANGFVATDVLPAGTTYLAGSLRIAGAAGAAGSPSDLAGDDLGEYDGTARTVRFYLGAGAAPGIGGTLSLAGQPGSTAQISFDAHVDENIIEQREIANVAGATFIAPSLSQQLSALSSPATTTVVPTPLPPPPEADLATAQTETVAPSPSGGDAVDSHILIEDHGPADATDVIMHAVVPPGAVIDSVTSDQGSCSIAGSEITCVVPHMDSGGSVDVNVVVIEPTGDSSSGSLTEATATAAEFDPTPANNSAEASAPPPEGATPAEAALAVDVHDSSAKAPLGGIETESITITNDGPDTATAVDVTDALGAAAELIAVNPGSASCAPGLPLQCTIDTLPTGSRQTIEVRVRPLRPGRLIAAATVSGDQFNPHLATDSSMVAAMITPLRAAARLRIVPVRPVTKAGQTVEFVVIAGVTKLVPGVEPKICVSLPRGLRLVSGPGATSSGSRLCWTLTDLVSGRTQSFRFRARVGAVRSSGASFAVRGRLTGANFAPTGATASVLAPPSVVACTSSATGRLAC